jgi:protease YdgD
MNQQLRFGKFLGLFIAGILSTLITDNRKLVVAQSLSNSTSRESSLASDPSAFKSELNANPYVPDGLATSEKPYKEGENTRAVIGFDERMPMTSTDYPWSAIGRIAGLEADGVGYTCTGTLLAPNIVFTNAHCVVNPKTHQVSQKIWFQPNLIFGSLRDVEDEAIVEAVAFGTDFRYSNNGMPDANDWAVLKINKPLGYKYGTLGWASLSSDILRQNPDRMILVGYSGDFPEYSPGETAGAHIGCSILGETDELLIHNCDTTGGASGGPIIAEIDGQFRVIGLHAGAVNFANGERINYAVKMSRLEEFLNGNR